MQPQLDKPYGSASDLTRDHKELLERVRACMRDAEPMHKLYRERWDKYYGLYRNYRKLRDSWTQAGTEVDRDNVIRKAQKDWRANLFIPFAFATVETIVPRICLNNPSMNVRPNKPDVEQKQADAVRFLFEQRAAEIRYPMILQPTVRRALINGIGIQKTYWNHQTRKRRKTVRSNAPVTEGATGFAYVEEKAIIDSGPMAEDVDPYDFFWDPAGKDIATCAWVCHRTWRNDAYLKRMVEEGNAQREQGVPLEENTGWLPLDLDKIAGHAKNNRSEVWQGRSEAAGITNYPREQGKLHEVWEYHTGERVVIVIDDEVIAKDCPTPFHHRELPFQIYRPIQAPGEFVGVGAIEPIAHLNYEMNTLRNQRRDGATLALQPPFAYRDGDVLDPNDLLLTPGVGIPMQGMGDIREMLQRIPIGDVPGTSYEEANAITGDIEMASGISDTVAGTQSTGTATGDQLAQDTANLRIKLFSHNLDWEVLAPAARQWQEMWRQHLLEDQHVLVEDASRDNGYRFETVRPQDVQADLSVTPVPRSMEADSETQKRNDALALYNQLNGNPQVDQRQNTMLLLRASGVPNPEQLLIPEKPLIDPELFGEAMAAAEIPGVEEDDIHRVIDLALQAREQLEAAENDGNQQALVA